MACISSSIWPILVIEPCVNCGLLHNHYPFNMATTDPFLVGERLMVWDTQPVLSALLPNQTRGQFFAHNSPSLAHLHYFADISMDQSHKPFG